MKFCMNCMERYGDEFGICPSCGFREGTLPTNSRCLTPGMVLGERYIVGMPLSVSEWIIRYIGWDALTEKRVVLNEYLPTRYAVRGVGETAVTVVRQQPFYQYMSALLNNARLLSETHLPDSISPVFESFEKNNTAYVVSAYEEGQPLGEYLQDHAPLEEAEAERLMLPVLRALDKLHENGFAAGGFSPENIFVRDGKLVFHSYIDNLFFHITDNASDIRASRQDCWYPPERLEPTDAVRIAPENDVYSAAMLVYSMLGVNPPDGAERSRVYAQKHRDILAKPTSGGVKMSRSKENAYINAAAVPTEFRTPNMEVFIKELTSDKEVVVNTQKGKGCPLWAKIAVPAAVVVLIASAVLVIPMLLGKGAADLPLEGQTVVPSVINRSLEEAERELKQAGLLLEIEGKNIDDTLDENTVLAQSADAGAIVSVNSAVGVTVSAQSGEFSMPNFLGMRMESCEELLSELGLESDVKYENSESVAQDCVMSQSVEPYTRVGAGQSITLTVSQGALYPQGETEADDFTGKPYEEVAAQSHAPVEVAQRVYDDSLPEGTVVKQSPAAGEETDGEPVELVVSAAQSSVTVPDVTLLDKERAEQLLSCCGLKAEFNTGLSDTVAEGLVVSQDPEAGAEVTDGASLRLLVSGGREKTEMPDVTGEKLETAAKLLLSRELAFTVTYDEESQQSSGTILRQSVRQGEPVQKGTVVTLVVNAENGLVKIPDIMGMELEEADSTVTSAGLNLLIFVDDAHPYSDGRVIAQGPKAGLYADNGSDLVVLLSGKGEDGSGPPAISISQQAVTLAKGEEFILEINTKNISNLSLVDYEITDANVVDVVHIDKKTLAMTFRGMAAGNAQIIISCGEIKQVCDVTVK